jgi:hypothetical protein
MAWQRPADGRGTADAGSKAAVRVAQREDQELARRPCAPLSTRERMTLACAIISDSGDKSTAYHDRVIVVTAFALSSPHRAHGCGMARTTNEEK